MELLKDFDIKDIRISDDFRNTTPGENKMERMRQKYERSSLLPTNIIINADNVLIDGYITYLLALEQGIEQLDVYRGYIEVIEAVHREGSKSFRWRVPLYLYGSVQPGDYAIVRTSKGVKRVYVKKVIQQQYPEQTYKLKRIIKKCIR